jgi:hypothetical protein
VNYEYIIEKICGKRKDKLLMRKKKEGENLKENRGNKKETGENGKENSK